jgi:hypothetical protein
MLTRIAVANLGVLAGPLKYSLNGEQFAEFVLVNAAHSETLTRSLEARNAERRSRLMDAAIKLSGEKLDEDGFAIKYLNDPRKRNKVKIPLDLLKKKTIPTRAK